MTINLKPKNVSCTRWTGIRVFCSSAAVSPGKERKWCHLLGLGSCNMRRRVQAAATGRAAERTVGVFGFPFPQNSRAETRMFRVKAVTTRNPLSVPPRKAVHRRLLPGLVSSSWAAADGDYATGFCVTSSESSCLLDHLPPMHHTPFCLFFHPPSIDSSWHEIAVGHLVVLGGGRTRVWSNAQGHD